MSVQLPESTIRELQTSLPEDIKDLKWSRIKWLIGTIVTGSLGAIALVFSLAFPIAAFAAIPLLITASEGIYKLGQISLQIRKLEKLLEKCNQQLPPARSDGYALLT